MAREVYFTSDYSAAIELDVLKLRKDLSGNQNDLALLTANAETIFDLYAAAALNVTGIVAPVAVDVIVLRNRSSATITLKHGDAASAAVNRFACPGGTDYALLAGAEVALVYNTTTSLWDVGTEVPRSGFKLAINKAANEGQIVLLNKQWWAVEHVSMESDGTTAVTVPVYYRQATVEIPTASYAANTAATRASKQILAGKEALLQIKRGEFGAWFLAASGVTANAVLNFRPNEAGQGFNR